MISEGIILTHTQSGFRPAITTRRPPEQVKYEYIRSVFASTGGNVSETARLLGMHRRSLQRFLATRWTFLRDVA